MLATLSSTGALVIAFIAGGIVAFVIFAVLTVNGEGDRE